MITKSQLQDGFKFTYRSEIYKLTKAHPESEFYYVESFNSNDRREGYVGNVETIEDEYFTLYTYIMMNKIVVEINYSDCYL
jgi:hypothetical protein